MANAAQFLPSRQELLRLLIAGVVAVVAWELFTRGVLPILFDKKLEPAILILKLFGLSKEYKQVAYGLHLFTGIVAYPIGYWIFTRKILSFGTFADGVLFGVLTWVFALGVIAPIAGIPFFVNFILSTWLSLAGHILFGLALAYWVRFGKP